MSVAVARIDGQMPARDAVDAPCGMIIGFRSDMCRGLFIFLRCLLVSFPNCPWGFIALMNG